MIDVFILAGGEGRRLDPLLKGLPKPCLKPFGETSFLQATIDRLERWGKITLLASEGFEGVFQDHLGTSFDMAHEPERRGTAAALLWALKKVRPKGRLLVTPVDHYFSDEEAVTRAIKKGLEMEGQLVIFGAKPTGPDPDYGYFDRGVRRFIEKPSKAVAEELILRDDVFWNTGMLLFEVDVFLRELKVCAPEFYDFYHGPDEEFFALPDLPIDRVLLEKTSNIELVCIEGAFADLGSIQRLQETSKIPSLE